MSISFGTKISVRQCMETGILFAAILIIAGLMTDKQGFYFASLFLSVLTILVPVAFRPVAILWFGLSKKMATITSYLLLGLIFYLIVTPVALFIYPSGKDKLRLKKFKKGKNSVFTERYHEYKDQDMIHSF